MRLINAETLKLINFHTPNLPRYAILSHTWGSSEITFRELRNLKMSLKTARIKTKAKAGYYKITKCCEQARLDGLEYVWVDTCCIDKSSSAELSEAINSMYRWYKNAAVCYVYLDDIDLFDPIRASDIGFARGDPEKFWTKCIDLISEKDLGKARWFTRGWTLQELIAPQNVVFYIKGWNYVGNKVSMREKLARITSIDEATLMTRNLEAVSVARRMAWAANRVTTRVEDLAYCLLGIFDVNMPLLYGEGENAFVRLQEEIMKDSEDQSLFAWRPADASEVYNLDLLLPMKPEEGRGVFARHPSEFVVSSAVRPTSSRGEPYTLTNKGVKMEIPILPLERGIFLIILECNYDGDLSHRLGIAVQKLPGGSTSQFIRHDMVGLIKVSQAMAQRADIGTVYLCKKVPNTQDYSSVFKIFRADSHMGYGEIEEASIVSKYSLGDEA
ncbi:HET-domain-containing protein [Lindgomyces ingoldianus]|uniref:HET-domain-containing protein n=1 Tax=Lindgomyces ingoldianus TaxID=673940 RepID=A0ACB6QQY8_9PLEO|nr:HET-domain-containing protein [Lindgomyces ingoldianus]KAF2469336.1 HET-domain-containing protein [Lindgomyces ingoldianus]